jgi:hypothetical protein
MSIELSVDNRRVNPVEESVDLAIRINRGAMIDLSSWVVRRMAPARVVICASPGLRRRGSVRT